MPAFRLTLAERGTPGESGFWQTILGSGKGQRLTHSGEDAAAQAEGNGNGSLAYAAGARVNQHCLPWLHASADYQRVVGCGVDNGHRGGLLQGPEGTVQGSVLARCLATSTSGPGSQPW